jgi:hypothetical protein
MGLCIPFRHKRQQALRSLRLIRNIGDASPLALSNGEPLLHLSHPRTMDRRNVQDHAWMLSQPRVDLFAFMPLHIVEPQMKRGHGHRHLAIPLLPKSDTLPLPCAPGGRRIDLPRARVKTSQPVQRPQAALLMLDPHRQPRLSGQGRRLTRAWLDTRLLIDAPHHVPHLPGTSVERGHRLHLGGTHLIPRHRWRPPQMMSPRLERVMGQNPLDCLGRDRLDHAIAPQLPGQCRAIPLRQRPPHRIRRLPGDLDHVQRHRRGKKRADGPDACCQTVPRCQGPHSARPTCGHAVRVTPPLGPWPHTCDRQPTAAWPVPVWPGPQVCSGVATPLSRWRGCGRPFQGGSLRCVPAYLPPSGCHAGGMTNQRPHVQFSVPYVWGVVLSHGGTSPYQRLLCV